MFKWKKKKNHKKQKQLVILAYTFMLHKIVFKMFINVVQYQPLDFGVQAIIRARPTHIRHLNWSAFVYTTWLKKKKQNKSSSLHCQLISLWLECENEFVISK